jgi:PAS domain S-box-containing protein
MEPQPSSATTSWLVDSREILYRIFEFAPDAIFLVDSQGRIAKANAQAEKMFGHHRDELIDQPIEILIPQRFATRHVGYRSGYVSAPHTRPMGMGLELFGKRKDGTEFPVDIMLSPLESEQDLLTLAVIRDATERKRIEAQARQAKEMYFKEVHHRVKNNLQVISSLLFLQSTYTTDPNTLAILNESRSRVKSIALIHEKLYRSPELVKLDFAEYVRDLVADLVRTYGLNQESLNVRTSVEDIALEVDTAIPCGLIINEIVSNALKYAFPTGSSGEISVELTPITDDKFLLIVRDDGVGLPENFDWRNSNSLGLKLVNDLTRQLDGTIEVDTSQGTTFRITFRELHYNDRS